MSGWLLPIVVGALMDPGAAEISVPIVERRESVTCFVYFDHRHTLTLLGTAEAVVQVVSCNSNTPVNVRRGADIVGRIVGFAYGGFLSYGTWWKTFIV